jgi:hypothetical protein
MVIIGVALLEELDMKRRHGQAYEMYRNSAPFLLPLPRFVTRIFTLPLRLMFGRERLERRREVAAVVGVWTVLLVSVSVLFYAGGLEGTLARMASPKARMERLQDAVADLEAEESPRYISSLAMRVASFGDPAVEPLLKLLQGEDPSLRSAAAEALGSLSSQAAVPALCAALSDPDENVRFHSLQALEVNSTAVSKDALLRLLDDPASHIRLRALAILARQGASEAVERAPEFLSDEGYWVRGAAVDALGVPGLARALPLVKARLDDPEEWVRRQAVLALLRIGSPAARPSLERMLTDSDFEVRTYAAEALKRLPGDPSHSS